MVSATVTGFLITITVTELFKTANAIVMKDGWGSIAKKTIPTIISFTMNLISIMIIICLTKVIKLNGRIMYLCRLLLN